MTSPIVITQGKSAFLHTTEGFPPYIMKRIGLLMSVSLLHRRNRLAQTCPVSFIPDWLMENLLCLQNKSAPSVQRFILKSSVCSNAALIQPPRRRPLGFGCHEFISPPRTSAKQSRHLCSPITSRLQFFVKRNPSRLFRFARKHGRHQ